MQNSGYSLSKLSFPDIHDEGPDHFESKSCASARNHIFSPKGHLFLHSIQHDMQISVVHLPFFLSSALEANDLTWSSSIIPCHTPCWIRSHIFPLQWDIFTSSLHASIEQTFYFNFYSPNLLRHNTKDPINFWSNYAPYINLKDASVFRALE